MILNREPWVAQALCAEIGPDDTLWYPEVGQYSTRAKDVCRACPVQAECLDYAVRTEDPHGIWGGTSPSERATSRRSRLCDDCAAPTDRRGICEPCAARRGQQAQRRYDATRRGRPGMPPEPANEPTHNGRKPAA